MQWRFIIDCLTTKSDDKCEKMEIIKNGDQISRRWCGCFTCKFGFAGRFDCVSNKLTMSWCPAQQAKCRGDEPRLSGRLGDASCINSNRTHSVWPLSEA